MDQQGNKNAAQAFASAFAESLSATLANLTGTPWPFEAVDNLTPPTSNGTPQHFRLTVEGALHGECFIELYQAEATNLIGKIRKQAVDSLTSEHIEELASLFAASTQTLAVSIAEDYGKVTFKVDSVAELAFGGMFVVALKSTGDPDAPPMLLYFDGQLLNSLSSAPNRAERDEAEGRGIHPHNLKMVMDVELNVSLRFGKRQLPLREVLELSSGSVIELDRMVDEPVDLYLDGKLIARGEAVIVDGNYGLRVTEIPQPVSSHFFA